MATLRRVDELTGAKPVFVTSGIPGTVGSGARELWKELGVILSEARCRGPSGESPPTAQEPASPSGPSTARSTSCSPSHTVVIGENYPRAAYALALSREDASARARLRIAKTHREVRQAALADLQSHPWLRKHGVRLNDIDAAANSEDAFDALLTAAGLLRCVLEGTPLAPDEPRRPGGGRRHPRHRQPRPRRVGRPPMRCRSETPPPKPRPSRRRGPATRHEPPAGGSPPSPTRPPEPVFPCPIPGCDHVFTGSRAGWDAHVASVRIHPRWQPDVRDPAERKALFRHKYARFFQ